jgi:hypothetical protein
LVKRRRGHENLTANCATDIGINSIHAQSMAAVCMLSKVQDSICRKIRKRSVQIGRRWSDRFVESE